MHGYRPSSGPIGIFDSGVGGLSVWREIVRQFPHEDTLYVADQAHMPYGSRSLQEVRAYCEGVVRFLLADGAKTIVIACNSASAAALHHLRALFPRVPFIGMEPAIKPAVERTRSGVVGVLATSTTFQGKLFSSLVAQYGSGARVLTQIGHGWAQAVESGAMGGADTESLVGRCLAPLLDAGADHLVLGCTHYPFLLPILERMVGPEVVIIDPAPAVARQTGRVLAQGRLQRHQEQQGRHLFCTTGQPQSFAAMLERLVGADVATARVEGISWRAGRLGPDAVQRSAQKAVS